MKRILFGLALVLGTPQAFAAAATDTAATISYEFRTVSSEGVTKDTRFQERLYRAGNQLWTERVLPKQAPHEKQDKDHADHEHDLALGAAAKYIVRDERGQLNLQFVRVEDKMVIQTEPRDYPEVGFDGSWDSAYYLINPAQLKKMQKLAGKAPVANASWYEQKTNAYVRRVLWADDKQMPLLIETSSRDGSRYSKTTITPESLPAANQLPWSRLASYQRRAYIDLLD